MKKRQSRKGKWKCKSGRKEKGEEERKRIKRKFKLISN